MEKEKIMLEFENKYSKIGDFDYGKDIYEQQAKDRVVFDGENIIAFPDYVDFVSPSFIQGFIAVPIGNVGKENVLEYISFESPRSEVVKQIYNGLRRAM
ncbi:MAG: hypothetical protein FWE11_07225 [Defluviitaleaceae bacterium]|nr:hypothetical protein [Defluviitaleaceae bacterium]